MGTPLGHIFYIGLHKAKHDKSFLSEITWTKTLIFGINVASPSGPLSSLFK